MSRNESKIILNSLINQNIDELLFEVNKFHDSFQAELEPVASFAQLGVRYGNEENPFISIGELLQKFIISSKKIQKKGLLAQIFGPSKDELAQREKIRKERREKIKVYIQSQASEMKERKRQPEIKLYQTLISHCESFSDDEFNTLFNITIRALMPLKECAPDYKLKRLKSLSDFLDKNNLSLDNPVYQGIKAIFNTCGQFASAEKPSFKIKEENHAKIQKRNTYAGKELIKATLTEAAQHATEKASQALSAYIYQQLIKEHFKFYKNLSPKKQLAISDLIKSQDGLAIAEKQKNKLDWEIKGLERKKAENEDILRKIDSKTLEKEELQKEIAQLERDIAAEPHKVESRRLERERCGYDNPRYMAGIPEYQSRTPEFQGKKDALESRVKTLEENINFLKSKKYSENYLQSLNQEIKSNQAQLMVKSSDIKLMKGEEEKCNQILIQEFGEPTYRWLLVCRDIVGKKSDTLSLAKLDEYIRVHNAYVSSERMISQEAIEKIIKTVDYQKVVEIVGKNELIARAGKLCSMGPEGVIKIDQRPTAPMVRDLLIVAEEKNEHYQNLLLDLESLINKAMELGFQSQQDRRDVDFFNLNDYSNKADLCKGLKDNLERLSFKNKEISQCHDQFIKLNKELGHIHQIMPCIQGYSHIKPNLDWATECNSYALDKIKGLLEIAPSYEPVPSAPPSYAGFMLDIKPIQNQAVSDSLEAISQVASSAPFPVPSAPLAPASLIAEAGGQLDNAPLPVPSLSMSSQNLWRSSEPSMKPESQIRAVAEESSLAQFLAMPVPSHALLVNEEVRESVILAP